MTIAQRPELGGHGQRSTKKDSYRRGNINDPDIVEKGNEKMDRVTGPCDSKNRHRRILRETVIATAIGALGATTKSRATCTTNNWQFRSGTTQKDDATKHCSYFNGPDRPPK